MSFLVMLLPSNVGLIGFLLLVAQVFLWMYNGPTNALIANCVDARIRTRAFSISILMGHAFGDAISPAIVGGISDSTGSLATAVLIIPFSFAMAAVVWTFGWRNAVRTIDPLTEHAVNGTASDGSAVASVHGDRDPLASINGVGGSSAAIDSRQILLLNDHLPSDDVAALTTTPRAGRDETAGLAVAVRTPTAAGGDDLIAPASTSGNSTGDGRVELSRKVPGSGADAAPTTTSIGNDDFTSML